MKAKKVFRLGILLAGMLCIVALLFGSKIALKTAVAEEVTNGQETVITDEITTSETTETHTVFSRVEEWFGNNFLEFISSLDLAAVAGCIVVTVLDKKSGKRNTEETKTAIATNTTAMKENTESNDKVLEVVNALIDSTNEMKVDEESVLTAIEQMQVMNKAILEILVTVYVNNKNIPQATKDLVNMKYVDVLRKASRIPEEVKTETEV